MTYKAINSFKFPFTYILNFASELISYSKSTQTFAKLYNFNPQHIQFVKKIHHT